MLQKKQGSSILWLIRHHRQPIDRLLKLSRGFWLIACLPLESTDRDDYAWIGVIKSTEFFQDDAGFFGPLSCLHCNSRVLLGSVQPGPLSLCITWVGDHFSGLQILDFFCDVQPIDARLHQRLRESNGIADITRVRREDTSAFVDNGQAVSGRLLSGQPSLSEGCI